MLPHDNTVCREENDLGVAPLLCGEIAPCLCYQAVEDDQLPLALLETRKLHGLAIFPSSLLIAGGMALAYQWRCCPLHQPLRIQALPASTAPRRYVEHA